MNEQSSERVNRFPLGRKAWSALVVSFVLALTCFLAWQGPRGDWTGRTFSLKVQSLKSGGPIAHKSWWVQESWDGPTGEFTHGQMYALKLGKRLIRLDIVYDPIAAIKKRLPNTVPGLLESVASKDQLVKQC